MAQNISETLFIGEIFLAQQVHLDVTTKETYSEEYNFYIVAEYTYKCIYTL